MPITITSWNCQGNSPDTISQSAGRIIHPQDSNIVLIQEAGSLGKCAGRIIDVKIAGKSYKAYFEEQEDASNKRCTTGILVDAKLWGSIVTTIDKCNFMGVRRPLVFCIIDLGPALLYVSTIHPTANHKTSKDEIKLICDSWTKTCRSTDNCWILMGDMNCAADELDIKHACKIAPDKPTQKSGQILDYAIMSPDLEPCVARFNGGSGVWVDEAYRDSDHLAVKICLDL